MSSEEQQLAAQAAQSAAPFVALLADRYSDIALRLRNGEDGIALEALGASSEDLEHFLQFLILVQDVVEQCEATVASELLDYRESIVDIVESISPALSHLDFVEVADTLEDDLVPSLRGYEKLDQRVIESLSPAA